MIKSLYLTISLRVVCRHSGICNAQHLSKRVDDTAAQVSSLFTVKASGYTIVSFNRIVAKVIVVVPFRGKASTHFVNKLVTTNIYLSPCDDVGIGLIIS